MLPEYALNALVTLFVVVDPIGITPAFLSVTHGLPPAVRRAAGYRAAVIAGAILIGTALVGNWLLARLGIGLPAFRISGGILLFVIAGEMVFGIRPAREARQAEQAIEEHARNIAAFPLAIPLIAGPGAITATLLLAGQTKAEPAPLLTLVGIIIVIAAVCAIAFVFAGRVARLLGVTGNVVMSRLLGVVLAALAVQFVIDGGRAAFGLERNVVVHVITAAGGRDRTALRRPAGAEGAAALVAGERTASSAATTIEHGQRRVEALQDDFGRIFVLTVLVLPLPGLERAFDINLRTLLQILLRDLAKPFIEDDDAMPLGLLLALASILVAPGIGGRDAQIDDRPTVLGAPDIGIRPEVAHQNDLVDAACHIFNLHQGATYAPARHLSLLAGTSKRRDGASMLPGRPYPHQYGARISVSVYTYPLCSAQVLGSTWLLTRRKNSPFCDQNRWN